MQPEIQGTIDDLKQTKDLFDKAIEVEAERLTEEEGEKVNPEEFDQEKMVFDEVTNIVVNTLKNPEVSKAFAAIATKIGKDETLNLINVITLAVTNAAAGSILFYDNFLREKLSAEYRLISQHINGFKAELEGYSTLTKIHKKKIADIENTLQVNKFKQDVGGEG